ncbi:MAG: dTMP kinase [Nitrososphaeria archaeon]|nr:dTMP kinase [Nitrososphaeria archaeon]MDW8043740.1 dTMP kinase [Nitrososphaerota archaeon]
MKRGALIAIEGIDGAGKTAVATWLVDRLRETGYGSVYTREPTDGPIGQLLRAGALGDSGDPRIDALLFAADRLYHLNHTIEPLLRQGYVVVSDRYVHSSIAYQGAMTGDRAWVEELNRFAGDPDLAVYLDVDPETGLRRKGGAGRTKFERPEVLEVVRRVYLALCDEGRLVLVDARRDLDSVREDVLREVLRLLQRV